MSLQSVNPATGEVLETFTPMSSRELEGIVAQSHAAFLDWRTVSFKARAERMREAAKTLRGISGADVVSMSAVVENDRITEFRTTVNIAFGIERS